MQLENNVSDINTQKIQGYRWNPAIFIVLGRSYNYFQNSITKPIVGVTCGSLLFKISGMAFPPAKTSGKPFVVAKPELSALRWKVYCGNAGFDCTNAF